MPLKLSETEIVDRAQLLPAFPAVVSNILATIDDDGATTGALVQLVERDPVVTARVLSLANAAAHSGQWRKGLRDMHVAVSLIGLSRVREVAVVTKLAEFAKEARLSRAYWQHSVGVAVAAHELAKLKPLAEGSIVSSDYAFVAGLLHDIGQLWMARFYPLEYQMVRLAMQQHDDPIVDIERRYFGTDHCEIGRILATDWRLPSSIVSAIAQHHETGPTSERLVAIVHLAEAIATALELGTHDNTRIESVSVDASRLVGIDWEEDVSGLLGRIEARARHICEIFT